MLEKRNGIETVVKGMELKQLEKRKFRMES
jgi:hypothetical protein